MRAQPITTVFTLASLDEPVLIAPRGDVYHDAKVLVRTWAGGAAWLKEPRCGAHADRWVAVDATFARLLDRVACPGCAGLPERITDAEIPTPGLDEEREEETP